MEEKDVKKFRTASGGVLTEEDIGRMADEVGSDEPVVFAEIRVVVRPSLDGSGVSPRLSFRVSSNLYDAAAARAITEGWTGHAIAREALEKHRAK